MRYSFNDEKSLIKEIEVFTPDKESQAIIFTPENISIDEIAKIKQNMVQNGYKVIAGEHENQAVLKVYGFDSANNLLAKMADIRFPNGNGAVFGDFQTSKTELDKHEKGEIDKAKIALGVATVGMWGGAASIATAGVIRGSTPEIVQGLLGVTSATVLGITALQTQESRMSFLYRDFIDFVEDNNIRIGTDARSLISTYEAPQDLLHSVLQFAYDHGPVFNNGAKILAGASGIWAGLEQGNIPKAIGNASLVLGMGAGILAPENHVSHESSIYLGESSTNIAEPPKPDKGFAGNIINWFNEKPQRYAGIGALGQQLGKIIGNETCDKQNKKDFFEGNEAKGKKSYADAKTEYTKIQSEGMSSNNPQIVTEYGNKLQELENKNIKYQKYANAVVADRASMGLLTIGYAAYTMTNKHNGATLDLDSIIEICANMVNDYPKEQQKAVTQRLATFLGNHSYVDENVDELVSQINHKMAVLAQSLWAGNGKANDIVKFECATRLDGADQEQVEMAWQKNEKPNSNVMEAKKQSLEKLLPTELQQESSMARV
jgi:hypothetical protein